jgi:hypothetical protein
MMLDPDFRDEHLAKAAVRVRALFRDPDFKLYRRERDRLRKLRDPRFRRLLREADQRYRRRRRS